MNCSTGRLFLGDAMNTCKDCKFWKRYTEKFDVEYHGAHVGQCKSTKLTKTDKPEKDGLGYWDGEGYSAGIEIGEDFGCVHWSAKP